MSDVKLGVTLWIGAICLGLLLWVGLSYMEARAYNRVTGSSVTTFDAMFMELRVQASPDCR